MQPRLCRPIWPDCPTKSWMPKATSGRRCHPKDRSVPENWRSRLTTASRCGRCGLRASRGYRHRGDRFEAVSLRSTPSSVMLRMTPSPARGKGRSMLLLDATVQRRQLTPLRPVFPRRNSRALRHRLEFGVGHVGVDAAHADVNGKAAIDAGHDVLAAAKVRVAVERSRKFPRRSAPRILARRAPFV